MDEKEAEARPVMGTIFLVLESSCFTLREHTVFLFPVLLSSYWDFCEKLLKKILKK